MNPKPTEIDAVRVWTGFRRSGISQHEFLVALGDTFVPGTLTMLKPMGISAYLVAVLVEDNPELPGESALVVYSTQEHYRAVTRDNLRGRVHRASHFAVFDMERSQAVFPTYAKLNAHNGDTYFLFDKNVDWQAGRVVFVVIGRKSDNEANVGEALAELLPQCKLAVSRMQATQCITVLHDAFAIFWIYFDAGFRPTIEGVQASLTPLLPNEMSLRTCMLLETLACFGDDAELIGFGTDKAVQFRFQRSPSADLY